MTAGDLSLPGAGSHLGAEEVARRRDAAVELAGWASGKIRAGAPAGIRTKAHAADWVTDTDVDVEREVRARLAEWFPSDLVVGEELGGSPSPERPTWYLDPIDGTTNFVHGVPWSSFSLAVADAGGIAAGVVADPYRGEMLSAVRGGGARLDGEEVRCSDSTGLMGGVVMSELAGAQVWPGLTSMMDRLAGQGCATRIMGSSALALATVGAGRALAAVLGGRNPIDVAAGVLVAREAGAEIFIDAGGDTVLGPHGDLRGPKLVAVAPGVAAHLLDAVDPDRDVQ